MSATALCGIIGAALGIVVCVLVVSVVPGVDQSKAPQAVVAMMCLGGAMGACMGLVLDLRRDK